jgi:DNA-binding transcriptional LysR family regulator
MARELIGGIEVFLTIVREGSLRAAARALGVGAPAISHQLKALEQRLGVDLMVRTTRSIELTQAGRSLLAGTRPALDQIANAIETTRAVGKSTTGTLRLTMPISAYRMLVAPVLPEFGERYPDVRLDFSINEGFVDIVRDGYHAGFRLGDRVTSGMVAVRLTEALDPCYFASPSYLEAQGRPTHPRDLLNHSCVRYRYLTANRLQDWQFIEDGQTKTIEAPVTTIFDAMEGVRQAVRDGLGVGWTLRAMIEDDLRSGALETVLEPYVVQVPPYYLFYPEQNRRFAPLRGFIELLEARRGRSEAHVG